MTGYNGNSQARELAELKEITGKLWKSVDSFKLSAAEEEKRTQTQIAEWTQVNLQLLNLLTHKTEEVERLAQNYNRLTTCLNGLDEELKGLGQQITALSNLLQRSKLATPNGNTEREIASVRDTISQISSRLNTLNSRLLNAKPELRWIDVIPLGWSAIAVISMCWVVIWINTSANPDLQYLKERVSWSLIKLSKLEKQR